MLSRIAQTTAALTRLKPVWNDRSISLSSKIRLMDLPNSKPVHSLMLSFHLFLCLSCLLSPFTVPCPRREAGDVWCLPPVWNLWAVLWFHFAISSLVLLSSPVTLSVLSFSACWPFHLNFFQKILQHFSLRDRLFLYCSYLAVRSVLIGDMCSMLPYDTGICCMHLYNT